MRSYPVSSPFRAVASSLAITFLLACAADKANQPGGSEGGDETTGAGGTTFFGGDGDPGGPGGDDTPLPATTGTLPTDSSDGADGSGFFVPPDGGVGTQCSPPMQDCPKGEKCTSYVSVPGGRTVDSTKCMPVIGNGVAGDGCIREADNDDCAAGFFCMTDVSGHTGPGVCLEYCEIDQPCEFGGQCFAFNDGALPVCEVLCDPLVQDCPNGQGCFSAFDNFVCAQPGFPEGLGGDGDPCATIQGCQPSLICAAGTAGCDGGGSCCTPVCSLAGDGSECVDPSEQCVAALDNPPPDLVDVGFCTVPA
jgi:hypothetical protein